MKLAFSTVSVCLNYSTSFCSGDISSFSELDRISGQYQLIYDTLDFLCSRQVFRFSLDVIPYYWESLSGRGQKKKEYIGISKRTSKQNKALKRDSTVLSYKHEKQRKGHMKEIHDETKKLPQQRHRWARFNLYNLNS